MRSRVGLWLNRFALLSAGAAMACLVWRASSVGLKQAVNAWASADNGDKAARFAAAEIVRWLEWAVRNYQSFVFGLALILFGAVIAVTGRVSRPIGYLIALSGLCLPSSSMDHRQQRFLLGQPDPHPRRNRPDPPLDHLASHSGPPNEDRRASRDHIRRNDLVVPLNGPRASPGTVEWDAEMRLARGRFALPGLRPGLVK